MALNVETLKSVLLHGQELSDNEIVELRDCMLKKTLKEMRVLSKSISVKLTGSSRKVDIVDHLISMAKIGAVRDVSADSEPDNNATKISYITDQVKAVLQRLPTFESVTEWKKDVNYRVISVLFGKGLYKYSLTHTYKHIYVHM